MEHHDNEQRLKTLQERLGQIKNKQEAEALQNTQAEGVQNMQAENSPPYPTYNPKATESSDEDIAPKQTKEVKEPSIFPWKRIFTLLIVGGLAYGGFYLYGNFDFSTLIPENTEEVTPIEEEKIVPLQYYLDFGEAKYLVIIASFQDKNAAVKLTNSKKSDYGENSSGFFFLPSVSNSTEPIYRVYLGPFLSVTQAKQWANLEDESEILHL